MAPHLRRFLDDIARGLDSEGVQGEMEGPIQRVTLVFPSSVTVPDEDIFTPALINILAIVKGRASALRIAYMDGDVRQESNWRLPYSLQSD
jgi:hypothetical protein